MVRFRPWVLGAGALVLMASLVAAEEPADLFKAKELIKTGNVYVLPAEQELADGMKTLRVLKKKVEEDTAARDAVEQKIKIAKSAIQQMDLQRRKLYEEYTRLTDVAQKNDRVASAKVLDSRIDEATKIKDALEKQANAISPENKTQFISTVIDLSNKVEKAQALYKEFAADEAMKAALVKINETAKPKMRFGPTAEFLTNAAGLKRWRNDVVSAAIPVKIEHNVSMVEVVLNGKVTRTMTVDTGASLVCVTADLAKDLHMVPGPNDATLNMVLADGRAFEAKRMILKSVRVGQFTVEDVECAVLPDTLKAAEPLLGGSFLSNFIVRLDPKASQLHLAVIKDPNKKISTASSSEAKDTKKPAAAGATTKP